MSLHVTAAQVSSNDFKTGMTIVFDGAPYKVVEFLHVKPGKGAAFVRSKLKNFLTGNSVDKTWRAGESVEIANIEKKEAQYTYSDGDDYVFMDMSSYEEVRVKEDDWSKYLKEGMDVGVLLWNDKVISVDIPNAVELEVVETDPGVKGNTAGSGGSKPAKLETGAVVQVPLFIQTGEKIKVDTRTDSYLSRAQG